MAAPAIRTRDLCKDYHVGFWRPRPYRALDRLSIRQRAAIVLHYYAGYSTKEIGSLTGSTAATVAVHLHRGRKRLREILEETDD